MNERHRNMRKYIIPAMVGNAAFFLLTIVDGIFVGNGVTSDALGAVSLAMPFITLFSALTCLFNVGGVTVASVRLGRGDTEGANQVFMHSLLINIVVFTIFTVAGVAFPEKIAVLLGANETFMSMVAEYIRWYSVFLIPTSVFYCLNQYVRNDGDPELTMVVAFICTGTNIVLDAVMIYVFHKGIGGAAFASGVACTVSLFVDLTHFTRKKGRLRIKKFKFQPSLYKKVFLRGLPEMISQFASTITTFSMNNMLISHLGDLSVNAFSIITYAGSLFSSLIWGLAVGLQPLYGLSYGAKDDRGLKYYFKTGRIIALAGGAALFLLTFLIVKPVCVLFGAEDTTNSIVSSAMPKYCLNFVFAAYNSVVGAYLFSTKRTPYAIVLNVSRSLVFNYICINFLPHIFGYDFVWYTVAIAEGICTIIALALRKASERNGIIYI